MKSRKENLFKQIRGNVFLDKFGVSTISISNLSIDVGGNKRYSLNQVYQEIHNRFEPLSNINMYSFLNDEDWDKKTYYIKDEGKINQNGYYGYGYSNLVKGQEKSIKIKSIIITFSVNYYVSFSHYSEKNNESFVITIDRKKQMKDYNVWVLEDFNDRKLMRPDLSDIQMDKEFYLVSCGLARVVKVYEYPNKSNLICDLDTEKGRFTKDIKLEGLYYLPYDTPKSKLSVLDKCENEIGLLPYVIRDGNTFNVYWKTIDDAADYIVSLYKIIEVNGRKELYHLNDYTVDRNENMFVISDLIGNTFVFKVAAEDRRGKIIALSRGIVKGYPTYLVEEN